MEEKYTNEEYREMDTLVEYAYIEFNKQFFNDKSVVFGGLDTTHEVDMLLAVMARNFFSLVQKPFYVDMGIFEYWRFCRKYGWKIKRATRKIKKESSYYSPDSMKFFSRPLQANGSGWSLIPKILEAYYK